MQGEDYGDFELMGTGDVVTEETFALWVLNGESDYFCCGQVGALALVC